MGRVVTVNRVNNLLHGYLHVKVSDIGIDIYGIGLVNTTFPFPFACLFPFLLSTAVKTQDLRHMNRVADYELIVWEIGFHFRQNVSDTVHGTFAFMVAQRIKNT